MQGDKDEHGYLVLPSDIRSEIHIAELEIKIIDTAQRRDADDITEHGYTSSAFR